MRLKHREWEAGRLTAVYGVNRPWWGRRRIFATAAWKRGYDHGKREIAALKRMENESKS